jgi:hypothetical protein
MNIINFPRRDAKVKFKRPSQRDVLEGRHRLAMLKAAEASGDQAKIERAAYAVGLHVERIRDRLAQIVAAGYGPVDAKGAQLYTVCPRGCGRLLEQYVHDRHGVRISTGDPEPCIKCAEMGVFS